MAALDHAVTAARHGRLNVINLIDQTAPTSPSLDISLVASPRARSAPRSSMPTARPYQPQEWLGRGTGRAGHMAFTTPPSRRHTMFMLQYSGNEDSFPSPPPPYLSLSPRPLLNIFGNSEDVSEADQDTTSVDPSSQSQVDLLAPIQVPTPTPILTSGPASRRSQSTSNISTSLGTMHTAPTILPPPPGPPPAETRSVSADTGVAPQGSRARFNRHGAAERPPLSPIPPTPTSYIRTDQESSDTMSSATPQSPTPLPSRRRTPCLSRRPAQKETRQDGIRDRRSKSRALRDSLIIEPPSSTVENAAEAFRPANLVLTSTRLQNCTASGSQQMLNIGDSLEEVLKRTQRTAAEPTPPYSGGSSTAHGTGRSLRSTLSPASIISPPTSGQSKGPTEYTPNTVYTPSNFSSPNLTMDENLVRYLKFREEEARADTDEARLVLFAAFMVQESLLQKERYAEAFTNIAPALHETTRSMWETTQDTHPYIPCAVPMRDESIAPTETVESSIHADSAATSFESNMPVTPAAQEPSPCTSLLHEQDALNRSPWNDRFEPCLSPIESTATGALADSDQDRGRPPSRWWESDTGSPESAPSSMRCMKWSRQETKRMSIFNTLVKPMELSKDMIEKSSSRDTAIDHAPAEAALDLSATGHDRLSSEKAADSIETESHDTFSTLDVSRLLTLPPTYPRHHPAVNNSHPHLEDVRQKYREVADMSAINKCQSSFEADEARLENDTNLARARRTESFRQGVQEDLDRGLIDDRIAAEAHRRFGMHELQLTSEASLQAYDRFKALLLGPTMEQLVSKISTADACMTMLVLAVSRPGANGTSFSTSVQVAGDEEPELLEQLTLLKWIFDARELTHKTLSDMSVTDKRRWQQTELLDPRYRSLPDAGQHEENTRMKTEVLALKLAIAAAAQDRFLEIQGTIQKHLSSGIEAHANAFWDIAPRLVETVRSISGNTATADNNFTPAKVLIPPEESQENPALAKHPFQYVFSALTHARNSTRQFIDTQINLLCLQHEIDTAAHAATLRLSKLQQKQAGLEAENVMREEERLTATLQAQVREIEKTWDEALGDALVEAIGVVRGYLERTGGWEDGLEG